MADGHVDSTRAKGLAFLPFLTTQRGTATGMIAAGTARLLTRWDYQSSGHHHCLVSAANPALIVGA